MGQGGRGGPLGERSAPVYAQSQPRPVQGPVAGEPANRLRRARAGQSRMTSVPQTPDGKHIAVAKLVGAGFEPALVPQARCERMAVISCAIEARIQEPPA